MQTYLKLMLVLTLAVWFRPVGLALAQQPADPLTVMQAYDLALNANDVEAAMALFADDAVITTQQGQFTGQEQIRAWLERVVAQNARIEVLNRQVSGDKVTWESQFFREDIESLREQPLEATAEAVIQEGKIQSFTSLLTEESQAMLEAAMPEQDTAAAAPEAAAPAQLPSTGGSGPVGLLRPVGLTLIGLLLAGAGFVARPRRRAM